MLINPSPIMQTGLAMTFAMAWSESLKGMITYSHDLNDPKQKLLINIIFALITTICIILIIYYANTLSPKMANSGELKIAV